ncbi:tryptophan synthase subunit alpha [Lactobacillus sp. ESL0791]|uniref:tryptophan synthase subunit alpha n=1 Tax=Lactobacillus sp. ESL0791 TaxID=2983234 RepID=UPI0023F8A97E|nr:tryptophan synthase subunit alpha [Lactobacillus sp. ESL0791]MDF7638630.1 tryptophan synthase subunit alpha [Lactobacillus sp. ESL0791]
MSNLSEIFKNKKAFIPFIVADDPDAATTVNNILALAEAGADIVELGLPFSDPVADGPVVQAADLRAFKAGVSTKEIFTIVEAVRRKSQVPLVFFTYLNIVFKYGYREFLEKCQQLNIAGLIVPDLPYESRPEIAPLAAEYDIDIIPLIAETSGDRIQKIAQSATGFIYIMASPAPDEMTVKLPRLLSEVRKYTTLPIVISANVQTAQEFAQAAAIADGVAVSDAFVELVGQQEAPEKLKEFAQKITAKDC